MTKSTFKFFGVSFDVPSNLKIHTQSVNTYDASSSTLSITVNVTDFSEITLNEIAQLVWDKAEEFGMPNNVQANPLRFNSLVGAYKKGVIDKNNFLIGFLVSENSNVAISIAIAYDDKQYELATKILNSFSIKE